MEAAGPSFEKSTNLYRERASQRSDMDFIISEIKRYMTGEKKPALFDEEEKGEILSEESELAKVLERIESKHVRSMTLFPAYFMSERGRKVLLCILSEAEIPENLDKVENLGETNEQSLDEGNKAESLPSDIESVKKIILENSSKFSALDSEKRKIIQKEASDFEIERLKNILLQNPDINTADLPESERPSRVNILFEPEKLLEKLSELRDFKKVLTEKLKSINRDEQSGGMSEVDCARKELLLIYLRKVNYLIADNFANVFLIFDKKRICGKESLSENELKILETTPGFELDGERSRSRMDKFMQGASDEYYGTEEGKRESVQVGQGLMEYWEKLDAEWLVAQGSKKKALEERGIDREKLETNEGITPDEIARWAREILSQYDILSDHQDDTDTDEKRTAVDDKWRVLVDPEKKSMEIDGTRKIFYIATPKSGRYSALRAISVALGHEISHVMQTENRKNIPLRMFSGSLQSSRFGILSEGGAMYTQNEITKKVFGFENVPVPHYIAAMIKKINGGDYLECVKTYYASSIREAQQRYTDGEIDSEVFEKIRGDKLEAAIDNVLRLFSKGNDLSYQGQYLGRSEDSSYLEQNILLKKLEDKGMQRLAYVGGASLEDFLTLIKYDFLNPLDIKEPDISLPEQKWREIRGSYGLG